MTVSQLIEQLQKLDPNFDVIISVDSEGNNYSPLADITVARYNATTPWYGEIEDFEEGNLPNSIVFFPVN